jgi:hypothetical protein
VGVAWPAAPGRSRKAALIHPGLLVALPEESR